MRKIIHVKANGEYYRPMPAGVQEPTAIKGCCYDVCFIKKLLFGIIQIDYYDIGVQRAAGEGFSMFTSNQKPNCRLIVYPSGIQEIKYEL